MGVCIDPVHIQGLVHGKGTYTHTYTHTHTHMHIQRKIQGKDTYTCADGK